MKCMLLGTGAAEGIPALFCNCYICVAAARSGDRNIRGRSCALINDHIMIDFPPDMLGYKIRYGLDLTALTDIFFTHSHIDHLAANELCYFHKMYSNRSNDDQILNIYGNSKVLEVIKIAFDFDMGHLPDYVSLNLLSAFVKNYTNDVIITALPAVHDNREECYIYLIEQNNRILIANDSAFLSEDVFSYLAGTYLDIVILDCTFGRNPPREESSHMCFEENLAVKDRLIRQNSANENTRFISHHFSHNGSVNYHNFLSLAKNTGFVSSYDGMVLDFGE